MSPQVNRIHLSRNGDIPIKGLFGDMEGSNMSYTRLVLLATAAIGLSTFAASGQTIATMNGQYYKLVPLKGALPRSPTEVVTVIPEGTTASVPQTSSCRLTSFTNGQYMPEWVTLCGPP
jgi:hypothetical protein